MVNRKWDIRFMRLAREIASWSKDPSSKLGAVIVNDERKILATGYNGFPKGIEDTEERLNNRELKYPMIVHAETNALMNALNSGVSVKGGTIYIYGLPPCSDCTKLLIQAGITHIAMSPDPFVYVTKWTDVWESTSNKMIKEVGTISVTYMNSDKLD